VRREALAYTAGVCWSASRWAARLLALRAAGGRRLGIPASGSARDSRPAAPGQRDRAQLGRAVRDGTPGSAINLASGFGHGRRLLTGALAAFIATPCTGPFMGAALAPRWSCRGGGAGGFRRAWARAGLALPATGLRARRCGVVCPSRARGWKRFRRLLSIPMFLTALALAWVLGRQAGVDGMTMGLAAALAAALGLWWVGRRQAKRTARLGAWCLCADARRGALIVVLPRPRRPRKPRPARARRRAVQRTRLAALPRRRAARSSSISPPTGA
jgi:hypothetical protein